MTALYTFAVPGAFQVEVQPDFTVRSAGHADTEHKVESEALDEATERLRRFGTQHRLPCDLVLYKDGAKRMLCKVQANATVLYVAYYMADESLRKLEDCQTMAEAYSEACECLRDNI